MFNVYFENRFNERIFIGEAKDDNQIYQLIKQDISMRAKPSFQWCYTRTWTRDNGEKIYDVSSHSEFYIAVPVEKCGKLVTISYKDFNKLNAVYLKDKLNI